MTNDQILKPFSGQRDTQTILYSVFTYMNIFIHVNDSLNSVQQTNRTASHYVERIITEKQFKYFFNIFQTPLKIFKFIKFDLRFKSYINLTKRNIFLSSKTRENVKTQIFQTSTSSYQSL